MTFKRWPHNKHGSRLRLTQLERMSTVNSLAVPCIMKGGDCECEFIEQCPYTKKDGEDGKV